MTSAGEAADLRVLLIGPSATHATVVRVRQELILLGLDVEVTTSDASADLASAARDHGAAAVARVDDSPPEIVLWVDAAHSAGAPATTRVSESLSGTAEPGLLALRAVELLRGRLIPVAAPKPTPPGASPLPAPSASTSAAPAASSTPAATAAPTERPPIATPPLRPTRARVHLGPALLGGPGGVPIAPGLRIGGAWRVAAPVELEALALVPLAPGTVSADEGEMDLRALAFGVGANMLFTDARSAFVAHAGGGVGVAGLLFEGRAETPWRSASGSQWSAMPFLGAGAAYRFTSMLAVRADLLAGFVLPEVVLVIANREVAAFGLPTLVGSISLEVHP